MDKNILDWWAGFVLVVSGLVLFLFSNLLIYDEVCFYENIKPVLYFEYLASVFVFAISLYVAWFILIKKDYEIRIVKRFKNLKDNH